LDNTFLNRLVLSVRSSTGNKPLPKERAMRQMLRTLGSNGVVGILIDQNCSWQEGVFVNFFGRPACTTNSLALLAFHTKAPVIPAFMVRLEDGRYRMIFGEEVEIIDTDQREHDVLINTQNFTRIIEEMISKYPDQWLWVHQRWKTQIPDGAEKA
jgi:KDO2-lipid IV(A) lauroyltransferase